MILFKWGTALLISLAGILLSQVKPDAHQGTGILFLNPPGYGVSFEAKFSPDSQFVVGTTISDTMIYPDTKLYVWDLRTADPDGEPLEAEPFASYDLSAYAENFFWTHQLAFSPDSETLAILLQTEILLLDFPELTVQRRLPIDDYFDIEYGVWGIGWISWSSDGMLLGAVDEFNGTLIVWDKRTDELLVRRASDYSSGLTAFSEGWVLNLTDVFLFCTPRLERCDCYPYEGEIIIMDSRNQLVVTSSYNPNTKLYTSVLWKQHREGVFEVDENYFADLEGKPHRFSPDGNYLTTSELVRGGSGRSDYSVWRIYDAQTHEPIPHLSKIGYSLWLGDTGYLTSDYNLYSLTDPQFRNERPAIPDDSIWAESVVHWSHLMETSNDGKWYLWNLGGPAMVVPVVYE